MNTAENKRQTPDFIAHHMELVAQGSKIPEDQRMTDWIHYHSLPAQAKALVLDPGIGTLTFKLAERCSSVTAVGHDRSMMDLIKTRIRQSGPGNVTALHQANYEDLPFSDAHFDLIAFAQSRTTSPAPRLSFFSYAQKAHALLKPGGLLFATLDNRLGFHRLLPGQHGQSGLDTQSIWSCRKTLLACGFNRIRLFAVVPFHDGIPMFYLPLDEPNALLFFFNNLFSLFETVSPEVRNQYRLPYLATKIGVRIALLLRLTILAKPFFPGFAVLADR